MCTPPRFWTRPDLVPWRVPTKSSVVLLWLRLVISCKMYCLHDVSSALSVTDAYLLLMLWPPSSISGWFYAIVFFLSIPGNAMIITSSPILMVSFISCKKYSIPIHPQNRPCGRAQGCSNLGKPLGLAVMDSTTQPPAQRRNPLVVALALLLFERRKLLRRDRKLIIGRWGGGRGDSPWERWWKALLWWLTVRTRISYLLGMNNSTIWIKYVATSCRDIIGMMIWIGVNDCSIWVVI